MPVKISIKKNISPGNHTGHVGQHEGKTHTRSSKVNSSGKSSIRRAEAPSDKCFWINRGPVVRNLRELAGALRIMTDEQFDYHTKRVGNDFAKWTNEVLHERACAALLRRIKTRAGAMKAIEKFIQ